MKTNYSLKILLVSIALTFFAQAYAQQQDNRCLGNPQVHQQVPFIVSVEGSGQDYLRLTEDLKKEKTIRVTLIGKNLQAFTLQPNWREFVFPMVLGFDKNAAVERHIRNLVTGLAQKYDVEVHVECNNRVYPQPSVGGAN